MRCEVLDSTASQREGISWGKDAGRRGCGDGEEGGEVGGEGDVRSMRSGAGNRSELGVGRAPAAGGVGRSA
eukprot:4131819-Pleurochrysis_carterae.AAC.1